MVAALLKALDKDENTFYLVWRIIDSRLKKSFTRFTHKFSKIKFSFKFWLKVQEALQIDILKIILIFQIFVTDSKKNRGPVTKIFLWSLQRTNLS